MIKARLLYQDNTASELYRDLLFSYRENGTGSQFREPVLVSMTPRERDTYGAVCGSHR